MTVRVQKWGNSLGVRIPKPIARQSCVQEGTELEVIVEEGKIVFRPDTVPTLAQLLAEMIPENRPQLIDWGAPRGKEFW